jgi:Ca2+-transporting ATPase
MLEYSMKCHSREGRKMAESDKNLYSTQGLSEAEVVSQRQRYGPNILPTARGRSAFSILIDQFKNPLIYIILVAAAISLIMGELGDFLIIMVVVAIDVLLGFAQEYQAQRTYKALRNMMKITAAVIREGVRSEIDVSELVPGDLVVLNAGKHIPGDGEIISSTKLTVDEAILTGESEPVNKSSKAGQNELFMGATVVTGRGYLKVKNTGASTELGKIAASQQETVREETPLQIRLKRFSRTLTYIVAVITLVILATGLLTGRPFIDMLRVSIVLAIAAVPEGLPIAVTVIQVIGMRKILKRNGLVQKLLAVETLGSVTVICTDKTGTLTEGRMRVVRSSFSDYQHALETMVLCNNLEGPVDVALWEHAMNELKHDPQEIVNKSERLAEVLFTSETKYMVTENRYDGQVFLNMKGAPEIVLEMCELDQEERIRILAQIDEWAGEGLRLLGFAFSSEGAVEDKKGFTWNGIVGMEDPIREGVLEAVQVAQKAGIKVKMITGDYRITAEHIARDLGIFKGGSQIMEGQELSGMDDLRLSERIDSIAVFARIRPYDKLRIIRILQEKGEIAAMIGDGVNDAPALKRANIGVVVGTATDVAKEIADIILLDNNFSTIVAAIEEGRVIFDNIQKVVSYVLSNSFAEILTIFVAMMLGWPAPLLVAQILWIHLICDGPADIMLGFEPKEEGIMEEKPKSMQEQILTPLGLSLIAIISTVSAAAGLILFSNAMINDGNVNLGRSYVFALFAVNSMVYIFAYRSMRRSIFKEGSPLKNKPLLVSAAAGLLMALVAFLITPLREVMGLVPLSLIDYCIVFGIAVALLIIVEIGKFLNNYVRSKSMTKRI